jgi:hypothetical protein
MTTQGTDEALFVFIRAIRKRDPRMKQEYFDITNVAGLGNWKAKKDVIAQRTREIDIERVLFGSDGYFAGGVTPAQAWADFRTLPLSEVEFRTIESNIAPSFYFALESMKLKLLNGSTRCGTVCSIIVYSVCRDRRNQSFFSFNHFCIPSNHPICDFDCLTAKLGKSVSYRYQIVVSIHGLNHAEPSLVHCFGTKRACDRRTYGSYRVGVAAQVCGEQGRVLSGLRD